MALIKMWLGSQASTLSLKKNKDQISADLTINNKTQSIVLTACRLNQKTKIIFFSYKNHHYKAHIVSSKKTLLGIELSLYFFSSKKIASLTFYPPSHTKKTIKESSLFKEKLFSPLTGRIIKIFVKPGIYIEKNQPLLIIESMKMENEIRAPHAAFVKSIQITEDTVVDSGQVVMTFVESGGGEDAARKNTYGEEKVSHR